MEQLYSELRGKTIALVYIFEGETEKGYEHYDIWKSDVITSWLNAIETLECHPFILDLRTFISKAMNQTLPCIDFVINLNNGNIDLSTLGLLPSVCSFLSIPCIPCDAVTTINGENKQIANIIAGTSKLNIPIDCPKNDNNGIYRPNHFGSSRGVHRGIYPEDNKGIYQEFIEGYDITTPIMYNPITQKMELLPTILYESDTNDTKWFLGEQQKATHSGFKRKIMLHISNALNDALVELTDIFSITTFCRIDLRIKTKKTIKEVTNEMLNLEDIYFIELNPMPTIRVGNNFYDSINSIDENSSFFSAYQELVKIFPSATKISFILACSMLSISNPNIKDKGI